MTFDNLALNFAVLQLRFLFTVLLLTAASSLSDKTFYRIQRPITTRLPQQWTSKLLAHFFHSYLTTMGCCNCTFHTPALTVQCPVNPWTSPRRPTVNIVSVRFITPGSISMRFSMFQVPSSAAVPLLTFWDCVSNIVLPGPLHKYMHAFLSIYFIGVTWCLFREDIATPCFRLPGQVAAPR